MTQTMTATSPADPAAVAFDELRRETTMLRLTIERLAQLATEKIEIPDYSEALGRLTDAVIKNVERLKALQSNLPPVLSPVDLARQIAHAGIEAREVEQAGLTHAAAALKKAASELRIWIESARFASVQNLRIVQASIVGVFVDILFWSMLPGVVARSAPASWHWPEHMAARVLRLSDWQAGERMMAAADPKQWNAIVAGTDPPKCSDMATKTRSK